MGGGNGTYTYCAGPQYYCKYLLERHHLVAVVTALNQIFGKGYQFGLAKISNGGIQVLEWPGKEVGMIKIFCFHSESINWTCINENEWHESTRIVIDDLKFTSELIALYGAPCWSVKELEKWNKAWAQVSVTVQKHSLYPTSKYISCGEVGASEAFNKTPIKKRVVNNLVPRRIKLRIT
jgi:hypothetical protein